MINKKDASDVDEKEALSEHTAFIYADNASEKKQRKWVLKNIHKKGG